MTWGEFVYAIRSIHLNFVEQGLLKADSYFEDIELDGTNFPFPKAREMTDMPEWHLEDAPLQTALEYHPVERVLLEGPLLPIHDIGILSRSEFDELCHAVWNLELQWVEKKGPTLSVSVESLKEHFSLVLSRLQFRLGVQKLKAM